MQTAWSVGARVDPELDTAQDDRFAVGDRVVYRDAAGNLRIGFVVVVDRDDDNLTYGIGNNPPGIGNNPPDSYPLGFEWYYSTDVLELDDALIRHFGYRPAAYVPTFEVGQTVQVELDANNWVEAVLESFDNRLQQWTCRFAPDKRVWRAPRLLRLVVPMFTSQEEADAWLDKIH